MIFIVFLLALAAIILALATWGVANLIVLGVTNIKIEIQKARAYLTRLENSDDGMGNSKG